jgi:hypothetical protein
MSVEELEWIDPDEIGSAEDEAWRIGDEADVDWCLRRIAAADTEIARVKAMEKAELGRIRDRAAALTAGHEDTKARMRWFLEEYLDRTEQKTVRGLCGTVSRVSGKVSLEFTDADAFISWALDNAPELLRYEPNKSADRWASLNVKPDGTFYDGLGDGFDLPGVRQVVGDGSVRVTLAKPKPELDRDGGIA